MSGLREGQVSHQEGASRPWTITKSQARGQKHMERKRGKDRREDAHRLASDAPRIQQRLEGLALQIGRAHSAGGIAAAALGPEQVQTLLMPSPWSSSGSIEDALALATRLGISSRIVPIQTLMDGFEATLTPALDAEPSGITAENLQSRIRGTLLMAMANQQGQLLLSTANKSALALGSCTLYRGLNGGLAVIGDLYKSTVFALCHWLDSPDAGACRSELGLAFDGPLIDRAILEKPPSAELRPDQKDSDALPDYGVLDPLLVDLIEHRMSGVQLINAGHDPDDVTRIERLFRRAEFKRRQAPPLLKVSNQAFGSGWRLPIAAI